MEGNIHSLISEYFDGNLSESELQVLKNHLKSNPSDLKIYQDYRLLLAQSGEKIALKEIDIENALKKTKLRLFFGKTTLLQYLQKIAAILLFAGIFSSAYIYYYNSHSVKFHTEHAGTLQEVSTIFGIRSKFHLPDGTTVNLNSGSKLIFPVEFTGNTRNVELVGEAFFDVTADAKKPFVVKTSEINVKVLGTAFNLQAYADSKEITTTLVHGKVLLEREYSGVTKQVAELKPLDRAVFHLKEKEIDISAEEDLDKFIAWKEGKLVFFNDPIEKVAEKLGYWYNVNVKIGNDHLRRYRFTATFTDEPIEQVLDLLSKSSPIRYQIVKASKLSDNSYSKREIIFN